MRFVFKRGKRTAEKLRIGVNFANDLANLPGEALVTPAVTAKKKADSTDITATFLESPAVDGTNVNVTIKAGANLEPVIVDFKVTTTNGFVIEHDVLVLVNDDA